MNADIVVVGAGTVGAAIGYGLAGRGEDVVVLDGGDRDFRAANANFGLVWQQGKGAEMPAYRALTQNSVNLWPDFDAELREIAGIDLQYERNGGLSICLGEDEFEAKRLAYLRQHNQWTGSEPDWEIVDRAELCKLMPGVELGHEVTGGGFGKRDGHVNPLRLLSALQTGLVRRGGRLRRGSPVQSIRTDASGRFIVELGAERVSAMRIVIAAGLGTKALAAQVGLDVPVRPQRGQILVTERLEAFLPLPTLGIRQTSEGTVMIGATHDEPGFDTTATSDAASTLSRDAIRQVPALREARLVRQWAGLRIMTPDGNPVYVESRTHPGAFVAVCHSGITLAAAHATLVAGGVAEGRLPSFLDAFHQSRFDVPKAA